MSTTDLDSRLMAKALGRLGRMCLKLSRVEMDFALAACAADSKIGDAPLAYVGGNHFLVFDSANAQSLRDTFLAHQKSGSIPQGVTGASLDLFRAAGSLLSHRISRILDGAGGAK